MNETENVVWIIKKRCCIFLFCFLLWKDIYCKLVWL